MRIPTLKSLQAFEAVARHQGFRQAADELCVTHAAISHQIRALEEELGVRLFNRTTRQVDLTAAGRLYYPFIRDAFQSILQGTERVRAQMSEDVLIIRSYSTFTHLWLLPRLVSFQRDHPDIPIRLRTSSEDPGLYDDDFDAGIFKSPGFHPGAQDIPLFSNNYFPVCSPALLKTGAPLRTPADLAGYSLLGVRASEADPIDWELWLKAARIDPSRMQLGTVFDNYSMAREAALQGMGVAIARHAFVAHDLAAGHLVRPFDLSVPEPGMWYFTCNETLQAAPRIRTFLHWLCQEIQLDGTLHAGRVVGGYLEERVTIPNH